MRRRLRLPSPAMAVALVALIAALGGTSYAAITVTSSNVRNNSLTGTDIRNSSITGADVRNRTLTANDFREGALPQGAAGARGTDGANGAPGPQGAQGERGGRGEKGDQGDQGDDATGRWVLVTADGEIEAQSGGFTIISAYGFNPQGEATAAGGVANVYIDAGEDLTDNGILASIALQNQMDQNNNANMNGLAGGSDANPEFSGEITATQCMTPFTGCAPAGANERDTFVVSPRLSDGSPTTDATRKRFYATIVG